MPMRSNDIPALGFGTYPLRGDVAARSVAMALEIGLRHIDTAQMYGNEADVGAALRSSSVPRGQLYVVAKVDPSNLGQPRFVSSVERSMDDLGGPADLLLIHWPPPDDDFDATIERLVMEKEKGMARNIGVSNFTPAMMHRAQAIAKGAIIANQVEFHPLIDQRKVLREARDLGITLTAYSPLARGKAMQPPVIQAIAAAHGRLPSEIVLRWIIQQGVAAIPMTTKRENALSNVNALAFELPEQHTAAISALGTREGRTINPSWMKGRWD
jgi:diketogulonate reductase-like aldo/keto reductase